MKKIKVEFDITDSTELHCDKCQFLSEQFAPRDGYYSICLIFGKVLDEDKTIIDSRAVYKSLRCDECIKNEVV